jgi:hypothetical protein
MAGGGSLLLLLAVAVAEGFCPYGCGCDETNSRVTCIKTDLEVRPFFKGTIQPNRATEFKVDILLEWEG